MKQIMLIEDEPLVAEALADVLSEEGYKVEIANNGTLAMQSLESSNFDLFIVDLFMPEKDGIATMMEIKKINENAKFIAISGGGNLLKNFDYLEYASALGALACFRKPVDIKILISTIAENI